ncbi:MAG TPA: glycosyltransferase family 2 protein [Candidatus Bathyarchaeia archaeon]|nr:glycosyltransferase family 2 protein [Candidatus Bathyarchaeia archaeon]
MNRPTDNQPTDQALRADTLVVIPCYNASPNVRTVIENVLKVVDRVLIIDDGSTDGCLENMDLPVRLIRLPRNQGKGAAMIHGFKAALEDPQVRCAVVVDADGQHNPNEIPRLYQVFTTKKADLVIGARDFDQPHVPWASWFGNTMTSLVTGLLLKRRLPDTQSGFRLHSRKLLQDIVASLPGGRYETEMQILALAIKRAYSIISVPIQTIYESGNPTSHFRKLRDSWRVWTALFRASFRR